MKLHEFKAGELTEQFHYKSFIPNNINHSWTWDEPELNTLIERATHKVGQLNGLSVIVPDVNLFIRMHVVKEANASSRIEGTQTAIDEAAQTESDDVAPEKRDDWEEVNNYIRSMDQAIHQLSVLPLSSRLLRQAHALLMQGVRGKKKRPGEFRTSQNWIGGTTPSNAFFVPPPHLHIPQLMVDLEHFWHNESISVPHLIRIAISHYQFETIHPFLDGNGRIGRLLITLYLVTKGLLEKPCLYLSDYFERHRPAYYNGLTQVRLSNSLVPWVRFFLEAIVETADKAVRGLQAILELKKGIDAQLVENQARMENLRQVMNWFYEIPTLNAQQLARRVDLAPSTLQSILKKLVEKNILVETTGNRRNRVYCFKEYLELFY